MNFILDLIGAAIIGSMLIMMMITFQLQMQEASERALYTMDMVDHMDQTATKLNSVIALAGIGYSPGQTVITATTSVLVFRTYWDFQADQIGSNENTLSIKLSSVPSPYGSAVVISQNGVPLTNLGYLFWINDLKFRYYSKSDVLTTTASDVRSAEVRLAFFRNPPRIGGKPIITKLQFKCFFMNAYMQGA
ncbi:MAG: hypothetical protein CVU48_00160 [Candidatus Cloacimonetes bacterium HGW-Cloacimonetes-1]|jgi:hypothetical protein|nr:MAG: hypothetical protein CVU48_00160 [Candidatus Cloacimonetes bacterium HGW-Cloacimonetes-1]